MALTVAKTENLTELLTNFLKKESGVKPSHWDSWLMEQLGITRQSANRIRRGVCKPCVENCVRLAKLMNKDATDLLEVAGYEPYADWKLNLMSELDSISFEDLQTIIDVIERALAEREQPDYGYVHEREYPFPLKEAWVILPE